METLLVYIPFTKYMPLTKVRCLLQQPVSVMSVDNLFVNLPCENGEGENEKNDI